MCVITIALVISYHAVLVSSLIIFVVVKITKHYLSYVEPKNVVKLPPNGASLRR